MRLTGSESTAVKSWPKNSANSISDSCSWAEYFHRVFADGHGKMKSGRGIAGHLLGRQEPETVFADREVEDVVGFG